MVSACWQASIKCRKVFNKFCYNKSQQRELAEARSSEIEHTEWLRGLLCCRAVVLVFFHGNFQYLNILPHNCFTSSASLHKHSIWQSLLSTCLPHTLLHNPYLLLCSGKAHSLCGACKAHQKVPECRHACLVTSDFMQVSSVNSPCRACKGPLLKEHLLKSLSDKTLCASCKAQQNTDLHPTSRAACNIKQITTLSKAPLVQSQCKTRLCGGVLQSQGMPQPKVRIQSMSRANQSIDVTVAAEDLKAGQTVLQVPEHLIITLKGVFEDEVNFNTEGKSPAITQHGSVQPSIEKRLTSVLVSHEIDSSRCHCTLPQSKQEAQACQKLRLQ